MVILVIFPPQALDAVLDDFLKLKKRPPMRRAATLGQRIDLGRSFPVSSSTARVPRFVVLNQTWNWVRAVW